MSFISKLTQEQKAIILAAVIWMILFWVGVPKAPIETYAIGLALWYALFAAGVFWIKKILNKKTK